MIKPYIRTLLILAALVLSLHNPAVADELLPAGYDFSPDNRDTDNYWHKGTWNYIDPDRVKLTDGVYGSDDWSVNYAGSDAWENAGEWVAWPGFRIWGSENYMDDVQVDLLFQFDTEVSISSIVLGTNQDVLNTINAAGLLEYNVVFPSEITVAYGGGSETLTIPFDMSNSGMDRGDGANHGKRHEVVFNFDEPIITKSVDIYLNNIDNINQALAANKIDSWAPGSQFWMFLDEVDFYGENHAVPEPSTLLLLVIGMPLVLALKIKKKKV